MRRTLILALALIGLTVAMAGCGREVVSSDRQVGETTGETTGSAEQGGPVSPPLQGVMDSYKLAQEEIRTKGGEKEAGAYRVGYIVEPAEGWWEGQPGSLRWRAPLSGENAHIEILPFDAGTGLLVPEVGVTLTVLDENGDKVGSKPLELYYAEFYHYANNFGLPGSGTYTLQAQITPPGFRRHGEEAGEGRVYTEPVTVKFEDVQIDTEEE